jgi:sialic acid synthase SpsE
LNVIKTLQNCFDVPVGYSDHYPGIFASILSASMGACVVEKHFTLDRKLKRQDYQVSIEYDELQELVENVHLLPILKGAFGKKICAQEQKWRNNARKSIVSAKDLVKGQTIAHDDVKIIRPASGLHPRHLSTVIGRTLQKNIQINTPILWEHI